ncbi:MAG TPA: cation diffusion facilitator family transporter [Candidatus Enterocola sp.]|nr:cation diffusion facilitator family transporter [Candidatus Enterocola sp.]
MTTDLQQRAREAKKVTLVGFIINLLLSIAKLTAGITGKSAAMVADAVHSISDFTTDVVVIAFVGVTAKDCDDNHHYGHGKYETFATLLISAALLAVGIGLLLNGVQNSIKVINGESLEKPGIIALIAAIVSVIIKEALYWYTVIVGKKINSKAVIANAWHHRSDAFSSIGTTLGIGGAIFLGEKWRILDPLAGALVSIFIIKVAIDLGLPSIKELLESSIPKKEEEDIIRIITNTDGVKKYHHLRTRKVGNAYAIDVHIKLDRNISFVKSHDIATDLEKQLRAIYGNNTLLSIHTEPLPE